MLCIKQAGMAQSVERRIGSAEVTGSIPVTSFLIQKRKPLEYRGFRYFFIFIKCQGVQKTCEFL